MEEDAKGISGRGHALLAGPKGYPRTRQKECFGLSQQCVVLEFQGWPPGTKRALENQCGELAANTENEETVKFRARSAEKIRSKKPNDLRQLLLIDSFLFGLSGEVLESRVVAVATGEPSPKGASLLKQAASLIQRSVK